MSMGQTEMLKHRPLSKSLLVLFLGAPACAQTTVPPPGLTFTENLAAQGLTAATFHFPGLPAFLGPSARLNLFSALWRARDFTF
jgi:hypothetical protein